MINRSTTSVREAVGLTVLWTCKCSYLWCTTHWSTQSYRSGQSGDGESAARLNAMWWYIRWAESCEGTGGGERRGRLITTKLPNNCLQSVSELQVSFTWVGTFGWMDSTSPLPQIQYQVSLCGSNVQQWARGLVERDLGSVVGGLVEPYGAFTFRTTAGGWEVLLGSMQRDKRRNDARVGWLLASLSKRLLRCVCVCVRHLCVRLWTAAAWRVWPLPDFIVAYF